MVCRADKTGLGLQSLRLTKMLNPEKVMLINSKSFKQTQQYPEWYKDFNTLKVNGFPQSHQIISFLQGLDTVVTCETWYSNNFLPLAISQGVKTVNIFNYEFFNNLKDAKQPLPDALIQPSLWHYEEMHRQFGAVYLPTPIIENEFLTAKTINLARQGKPHFLFINGKTAAKDRNGLEDLYRALKHSIADYTLTIKAQHNIPRIKDDRIRYDFSNPIDQNELYAGYDCLIMPRRYGGQCLPMCEALASAMPVLMPDIDPNNKVLPKEWLIPSKQVDSLMVRTLIEVYSTDPTELAKAIDSFKVSIEDKQEALKLAEEYSPDKLLPKYLEVLI